MRDFPRLAALAACARDDLHTHTRGDAEFEIASQSDV